MKRQAATTKGLKKRIQDLDLGKVTDPRQKKKVTHKLPTLLSALIVAMVTGAKSLRRTEERTDQIKQKHNGFMGIFKRIADNTFSKVLPRLQIGDLLKCLHSLVKAEHRRGNLKPTRLPFSTVAIDGKNVATIHWNDLCRILKVDKEEATAEEVKTLMAIQFPFAQICEPRHGKPYALCRVHTATLVSSESAICIHQRPIPAVTNEIGAMPELLRELKEIFGRTNIIKMITIDAGNTSLKTSEQIVNNGWSYFSQIKEDHGQLFKHAHRTLSTKTETEGDASYSDQQKGKTILYFGWQYDLTDNGYLNWTHARQLIRVERIVIDEKTGEQTVGNRYYVCNLTPNQLSAENCLKFSRAHWRCEEETHWTADVIFSEDQRRLAWSRHPNGVFVAAILRIFALNIISVARKLSRIGYSSETPSWKQVVEYFFLNFCGSILITTAFDTDI